MNWFFIALISPILYAITNHTDKYILEKYFKAGEVGAVVIFSAIFSAIALPVIYFIEPAIFSLGFISTLVLVLSGALEVVCLILYFKSLRDDEASVVVPFYQTIPVFGFILGYFILGEALGIREIFAGLLIVAGTTLLALDLSGGKIHFKKRVVLLMLLASLLFAASGVVFKLIALEAGFWESLFWSLTGKMIFGILLFVYVASYRNQFLKILKVNSLPVLSLNSMNEVIFVMADGIAAYAFLLAPIALVLAVNGLQPLFVFIFGILLTLFFPKIGKEAIGKRELAQKFFGIVVITVGTYLLGVSGAL